MDFSTQRPTLNLVERLPAVYIHLAVAAETQDTGTRSPARSTGKDAFRGTKGPCKKEGSATVLEVSPNILLTTVVDRDLIELQLTANLSQKTHTLSSRLN
jgi:hypothetical protein